MNLPDKEEKERKERFELKQRAKESWKNLEWESMPNPVDYIPGYIEGALAERALKDLRHEKALELIEKILGGLDRGNIAPSWLSDLEKLRGVTSQATDVKMSPHENGKEDEQG